MSEIELKAGEEIHFGRSVGRLERWLGTDLYRMLKGLVTNPLSVSGLILLGIFVFIAIAAPVLAPPPELGSPYEIPRDGYSDIPRDPGEVWRVRSPESPFWWKWLGREGWIHLLGTSSGQYDIWYGIVWGTRTALRVGVIITACGATIGIIVGMLSAYYGGFVDMLLMRITDIFIAFPFMIAALTLSAILTPSMGKSIVPVMIALTAFGWTGYARLLRSDILSVKQREYVLAAKVVGVRDSRIMFRHILPNAIFPTLVVASMATGTMVLNFAGLSFLGIGAERGYADWGQIISFARDWITDLETYWYTVIYPGLAITLFVMAWNLVGDAMRDILDPRMRGTTH